MRQHWTHLRGQMELSEGTEGMSDERVVKMARKMNTGGIQALLERFEGTDNVSMGITNKMCCSRLTLAGSKPFGGVGRQNEVDCDDYKQTATEGRRWRWRTSARMQVKATRRIRPKVLPTQISFGQNIST